MSDTEIQNVPTDDSVVPNRRKLLKLFGLSAAGMTFASSIETSKKLIKEGGDHAKEDIDKLKKAYEELDRRSKLILRVVLVFSGLDIFF